MFMEALSGMVLCDVSPSPRRLLCFAGADVYQLRTGGQATQILEDLRQCGGAKVHLVTVAMQRK